MKSIPDNRIRRNSVDALKEYKGVSKRSSLCIFYIPAQRVLIRIHLRNDHGQGCRVKVPSTWGAVEISSFSFRTVLSICWPDRFVPFIVFDRFRVAIPYFDSKHLMPSSLLSVPPRPRSDNYYRYFSTQLS